LNQCSPNASPQITALIEEFGFVDEIELGSASLSKLAVKQLDERMPDTAVGWSGQGYDNE